MYTPYPAKVLGLNRLTQSAASAVSTEGIFIREGISIDHVNFVNE